MEEMPEIAELAKILKERKDVAVVTISVDETAQDALGTLRSLLKEEPPFLTLMDPDNKIVRAKFGTTLFPETWFIDKNGVIRARFDGPRDWEGALPIDLARSLDTPIPCEVAYSSGHPTGPFAGLCGDVAPGS